MIASHYAEPLARTIGHRSELRAAPSADSEVVGELDAGAPFAMIDNSVGWAWGYGGEGRRVGYVRADAVSAA